MILPMLVCPRTSGMIRSFSYGDKLTQTSLSGMVNAARKYLTSFSVSVLSSSCESLDCLWSTIKSKRKGFSGWILRPRRTGGSKAVVKPTAVPGAGKTCAPAGVMTTAETKLIRITPQMSLRRRFADVLCIFANISQKDITFPTQRQMMILARETVKKGDFRVQNLPHNKVERT